MRSKLHLLCLMALAISSSSFLYAQTTCATATTIVGTGLISDPGPSGGSGCFNCGSATNASWYSFTAPADGTIDVSACGLSGTDTRLWVYDGSCGALNQIGSSDDDCGFSSEVVGLPVTLGATYYFEWDDRWSTTAFDFNFVFSPTLVTGNNTCANAAVITSTYDTISDGGPTTGAGCFNCSSGAANASWYSFTAPSDGNINISACGLTGIDTRLWLYEGSCGALVSVANDDDACGSADGWASELVGVPVTAGVTYYLEWDDRWTSGAAPFDFIFSYQELGKSCALPNPITQNGLYSDSGPSGGSGCNNCSSGAANASWYSFTPSTNGTVDISACGLSGTDTRLWVYDGSCGALNQIAADDDACTSADGFASELLGIPVTVGTTYYFEWDDRWSAAAFDFNFTFTAAACALTGTYTIDAALPASASNYQSFSAAAADLMGCGVSGPVTFNVAAGNYTDSIFLGYITGSDATNTITFDGGDSTTTTLAHGATTQNATVLLDSAQHLTFTNLKFTHPGTTDAFAIRINQDASGLNVTNCNFVMASSTSSGDDIQAIVASGSATSTFSEIIVGDNITLDGNSFYNGTYAMHFEHDNTYQDTGLVVTNNRVFGAYHRGILTDQSTNIVIEDNHFEVGNSTSAYAVALYDVIGFEINNNYINSYDEALLIADGNFDGRPAVKSNITNNFCIGQNDEGADFNDFEFANIYHNTFVTNSASTAGHALYLNDLDDVDIKNNIFHSNQGYAIFSSDAGFTNTNVTVDYNLYYAQGSLFVYEGSAVSDFATWQTSSPAYNANSVVGDPVLVDPATDAHALGLLANNAGTPIATITTDIDGDPRSATTPDIGADEFSPATCFPSSNMVATVIGPDSLVLNWVSGAGSANYNIEYGTTGFTPGAGTFITALTDTFTTVSGLNPNTTYDFYIQDSCGLGDVATTIGPFTFATSCLSFNLPYSEGFDAGFPNCWATNDATYAFASSCALSGQGLIIYSPNGTYAETPILDASGTNKVKLAYFYRGGGTGCGNSPESSDSASIEYWDGSQWVNLKNYNGSNEPSSFTRDSIEITTGLTAGFKVRFVLASGTGQNFDSWSFDSVTVEEVICPVPTGLGVANVTTTSADLSWTTPASASQWVVESGSAGFSQGAGTQTVVSTNPYSLTGLSPATAYDFYVASLCGPGDTSAYAGPFSFYTNVTSVAPIVCGTGNLGPVFVEEFDNGANGWTGDIGTSNGDWEIPGGPTSSNTGPNSNNQFSGANGSFMSYEASASTANSGSIVSPAIDLSAGNTGALLSFWMYAYGGSIGTMDVGVSTSPTGPFTNEFSWTGGLQTAGNQAWTNVQVDLSSYLGQTIYIEFFNTDSIGAPSGNFDGDIAIDLVEVTTCLSCPAPSALGATNILATSADVFWTTGGSANWDVQYGTFGFALGTGTVVNATNDTTTLSGLTPATDYEFYVRDSCAVGDVSAYVGPFAFSTPCVAFVAPYNESFDGLALTSPYRDLPLCWEPQVGPDFWDVTNGSTNSPQYLPGVVDHTTGSGNFMWIDASSDITANEMVTPLIDMSGLTNPYVGFWFASNNTTNATNHTIALDAWDGTAWVNLTSLNGNFATWTEVAATVPATIPTTTKFRIYAIPDVGTTALTYFQNDLGVDDFFVIDQPTCPSPSALGATNIATTSADIFWTTGGATNWNVEYGVLGFAPGTGSQLNAVNDTVSLSSLLSGTTYEFYVRDSCGLGDVSTYVGPFTFTTLCASFLAPYTESFNVTSLPNCWSTSATTGGPWEFGGPGFSWNASGCPSTPTDHTGNSGSFAALDHSGSDVGILLEMPDVDVSALTTPYLEFYFWMCSTGYSPSNKLYVETFDGTSWTVFDSIVSATASWQKYGFDMTGEAQTNNILNVRFRAESGGNTFDFYGDNALDDVSIIELPSCNAPTSPVSFNATTNSADVTWTTNNTPIAGSFIIEYDTAGFAPGTGNTLIVTNDTATISGLTPNTAYDYYVAAICGPGDTSAYAGPVNFITNCAIIALPYTETFEATTSTTLSCWTVGTNWALAAAGGFGNSSTSVVFPFYTVSASTPFFATSPEFSPAPMGYQLSLDHAYATYITEVDSIIVEYSTDGGLTYSNLVVLDGGLNGPLNTAGATTASFTPTATQWSNFSIGIPMGTNRVRIAAISAFGNNAYFDNVSIEPAPACAAPTGLTAFNTTTTATDVTWTTNNTPPAGSFIIEYDTVGFALGTGSTSVVTNDTTTLSGLTQNTSYDFYVRAICGPGDTSAYAGPLNFITDCAIIALPYTETFEPSTSTTLSCWTVGTNWALAAAGGFGNSSNSVIFPFYNVPASSTRFFAISPEFTPAPMGYQLSLDHAYATFQTEVDSIIVEYSTDGGLTYTNLIILDGGLNGPLNTAGASTGLFTPTATQWSNFSISIPMGTNRVRIAAVSAFGNNAYFDNVSIEPVPVCNAPTGVAVANVTTTGADVSWVSGATAVSTIIEYGATGFVPGTGTIIPGAVSAQSITGLIAGTVYDACVYDICGPGDTSLAACVTFTTLCPTLNAGTSSTILSCSNSTNVQLTSGLGTYDFGGTWLDDDATGALTDSIFDASAVTAGNSYNFSYIVAGTGGCPDDTAVVTVTVTAAVSAGASKSDSVCDDSSTVDLTTFLDANATAGGTWVDVSATGALAGSIFDATAVSNGATYSFRYVVTSGACPDDSATIDLFVEDCDVSLNELSANAIKVYPNPTNSSVTIEQVGSNSELNVIVYSAAGQKLMQNTFAIDEAKRLDFSSFAVGVYTLHIRTENGFAIKQVVKQ